MFKQVSLKFVFLSLSCILLSTISYSQSWQWAITGGGVNSDKATDMDIDANGNVYVSGYYNVGQPATDLATFGTIIAPAGTWGKEGFVAKVDPNGNWIWLNAAIGGWDERVLGICVDKVNGFVYATGTTWTWGPLDQFDFGNCSFYNNPGASDEIFVGKFDLNGNCIWEIGAGSDGDDHGYDLVTDKLGNIYLTGFIGSHYGTGGPARFGTISVPFNYPDSTAFVAKISPNGAFQWVKTFQAIDYERDNRIAIDTNSNVYITGGFWGTKQFGTQTVTSAGGQDIFVLKFDSNGNQIWLRTTGSTYSDRGNAITVDSYGDVYVTGEFRDRVGFGTDTINNNGGPGGRDIFVAKITVGGNWVWAKKAGSGSGSDRGNRITSNRQGNIFVTGQFKGNAQFGGNITLNNTDSIQVFVAAIDTSGKWRWALQAGGPDEDRGNAVCADDSCYVYATGYYPQTAEFDSLIQISSAGRKDVFVGKIGQACFQYTTTPPVILPTECTFAGVSNIFTPNADNINETFFVDSTCVNELSLTIYNRWGNKIIELTQPFDKWDGTYNGKEASEGVYYYVGNAKLKTGDVIVLKGFISLLR